MRRRRPCESKTLQLNISALNETLKPIDSATFIQTSKCKTHKSHVINLQMSVYAGTFSCYADKYVYVGSAKWPRELLTLQPADYIVSHE